MPIIEIFTGNQNDISGLVSDCESARKPVQQALDIPDKDDWEHRITVKPGLQHPEAAIEFTYLGEDYPLQRPGVIFSPSPEQIQNAGQAAQSILTDSLGEKPPVMMKAWHDTSFLVRDPDHSQPPAPLSAEVGAKLAGRDLQTRIEVALSPKLTPAPSGKSGAEIEPVPENPYNAVINEISTMVRESLGLPPNQVSVVPFFPQSAATDFSVNIFIPEVDGKDLPVEIRDYLAQAAEVILNSNQTTQDPDLEATVWVLPGHPDVFPIKT